MSFEQIINELRYGGPHVRIRAANALAQTNNPQVVPFLLETLGDEDSEVRIAAANTLVNFRDPRAVPVLIGLLRDNNFSVAEAAATTLGLLGDPAAGKPLLDLVERAKRFGPTILPQHQAILQALIALGRLKDPRATSVMIKFLKKGYKDSVSDWVVQVRQVAALGLGMLDQPAGVEALIDILKDSERPEVVSSSITGLGMLRSEQSFRMMTAALPFAPFEDQVKLWRRQQGLIIALGQRGDRAAVPYLLPLVKSPFPEVRVALSEALVRLGETEQGQILIPLLRDRISDVRHAAAQALGQLGVQAAAGPLSAVAVDPDKRVALAASAALENLKALPSAGSGAAAFLPSARPEPPENNSAPSAG